MSEQTSQEPTMEEILASIRRIISEDDAPAAEPEAAPVDEPAAVAAPEPIPEPEPPAAPAPEPVAAAAPSPVEDDDDDALELTEKVETHGDLDVYTPPAAAEPAPIPAAAPAPAPAPRPVAAKPVEALVSERASAAAATAFGQLSAAVQMPAEGRTLEDVVREMLRPLLQQWLDDNLPTIVQTAVEAEVERIARGRVR
jgi:cell pole-organizing protein PopZ